LRGHRGPIIALAFAPAHAGKPALLTSAAREPDDSARSLDSTYQGVLRLWDVVAGKELARSPALPDPSLRRPTLTAWHTGPGIQETNVALAWGDGQGPRVWDVKADRLHGTDTEGTFDDT